MNQLSKGRTSTFRPDVRFAFVLSPDFTLTPFAGFIDAVRLSADERDGSRQIHCNWTCIGCDTRPVRASCGIEIKPWQAFDDPENYDYIVIVGGLLKSQNRHDPATYRYLKAARDKSVPVVGLCTGGFVMAEAGLMDGFRCAVHVDHRAELVERHPNVIPATNEVYVFDQGRITCPGGTASVDLAVEILSQHCGVSRGTKGLAALVVDEHRRGDHVARLPFQDLETCGDRLVEAGVRLMRQSLRDPMPANDLANRLATSRRQLDRAFKNKTGRTPITLWREMRLEHARWRLVNSSYTVTQIAHECGFADSAHFIRWFKKQFAETPQAYRESRRRKNFHRDQR